MLIMYFFLFILSAGRTSIYLRIFNKAIHYTPVSFILGNIPIFTVKTSTEPVKGPVHKQKGNLSIKNINKL